MSYLRRRTAPDQRSRLERLRRGVVLALLALFSQTIIALLPMPAMAIGGDGVVLCSGTDGGLPAAPRPGKAAPHTTPACPVCLAGHLAVSLLPPGPMAVIAHHVGAAWRPVATVDAAPPVDLSLRPQQARAPPPSV